VPGEHLMLSLIGELQKRTKLVLLFVMCHSLCHICVFIYAYVLLLPGIEEFFSIRLASFGNYDGTYDVNIGKDVSSNY
jgi:hypothetical protein